MKRPEMAGNVRAFSAHFNTVAACVSSSILAESGTESRGKILFFWIKVLEHLRVLRNYESTLAVVAGLTSTPINRLKVFFFFFCSVFSDSVFSEHVGCGAGGSGGVFRGLSQSDGEELCPPATRGESISKNVWRKSAHLF
jgi:hypothetical protein